MKTMIDYSARVFPCDAEFLSNPKTVLLRDKYHADGISLYICTMVNFFSGNYILLIDDEEIFFDSLAICSGIEKERVRDIYTYLLEKKFFTRFECEDGYLLTNATAQLNYAILYSYKSDDLFDLIDEEYCLLSSIQKQVFDTVSKSNSKYSSSTTTYTTNTSTTVKVAERKPTEEEKLKIAKIRKVFPNLNKKLYGAQFPNDAKLDKLISAMKKNYEHYKTTKSLDWVLREADNIIAQAEDMTEPEKKLPASVVNANSRIDRERYYFVLRSRAESKADKVLSKAREDKAFCENEKALATLNIERGKAMAFEPLRVPTLDEKQRKLLTEQEVILSRLGISASDLKPKYACKKCSDSGYLSDGSMCDCYGKEEI